MITVHFRRTYVCVCVFVCETQLARQKSRFKVTSCAMCIWQEPKSLLTALHIVTLIKDG